ncbi:MAG: YggT family protein [Candidatus Marinimicrobia bacterium]|nr:YggT family protein [Candidatus Neomarinimicrobiota bacterium]
MLYMCLIARVILSWIDHNPKNEIIQWIYKITDPIIRPIQQMIPPLSMGIDISPILAFIALGFVKKFIIWVMF